MLSGSWIVNTRLPSAVVFIYLLDCILRWYQYVNHRFSQISHSDLPSVVHFSSQNRMTLLVLAYNDHLSPKRRSLQTTRGHMARIAAKRGWTGNHQRVLLTSPSGGKLATFSFDKWEFFNENMQKSYKSLNRCWRIL